MHHKKQKRRSMKPHPVTPFNATEEIKEIQERRKLRRRKRYTPSQLKKYRAEIVALKKSGASFRLIAEWLTLKKHLKVNHTTIIRFAKNLPELQEKQETRAEETHAKLS